MPPSEARGRRGGDHRREGILSRKYPCVRRARRRSFDEGTSMTRFVQSHAEEYAMHPIVYRITRATTGSTIRRGSVPSLSRARLTRRRSLILLVLPFVSRDARDESPRGSHPRAEHVRRRAHARVHHREERHAKRGERERRDERHASRSAVPQFLQVSQRNHRQRLSFRLILPRANRARRLGLGPG